ncbi:homeobox protein cut-like 2 isoform X2 [Carassius auratus]|uniref:Homeobox protein cut-like 2 isoform X2 n=1 Tax=Carassius auratus TaxID=7957 RepID=A0A6P6MLR4_CARAU|nr:homeobox protein cut-like 2 isoform X2 [Carassius auratus]
MDLCVFPAASPPSADVETMVVMTHRDVQRLKQEVRRLQSLLQEVQKRAANHVALLQQQLANKAQHIERLQTKLQSQQDYDKIKAELRTLRAQMQTTDVVSVSLRSVSADNDLVIQTETTKFHHSIGKEEALNESSSSSSPSSPSLQSFVKEETDPCGDVESEDGDELDTAGLAQQVREALQRLNIGQRVFGHYVLGLSQGTVSDILARPKPWSKLTNRGREPFLRMKHFLSDQHSIRTLSHIQERLRGVFVPWVGAADVSSDDVIRNILDQSRREMLDDDDDDDDDDEGSRSQASDDVIRNILQQAKHEMHTTNDSSEAALQEEEEEEEEEDDGTLEPSVQSPADFVQSIIQKVKCELDEDTDPSVSPSSVSRSSQTLPVDPDQRTQVFNGSKVKTEPRQRPRSCPISSSCELQSLDLDTFSITQRVKEALTVNNIGQRVFGEEVLGLTQSSVSELLSHPKPWTKLSLKGKENFIRMHLWLQDPQNIQKLNAMKKMDQRGQSRLKVL